VSRLAVIKHLVDLGSAVGSIANLPLAALHEMPQPMQRRAGCPLEPRFFLDQFASRSLVER